MWFVMSRLVKKDNQIMRIISQRDNQVFVIDCIKKTMPKWISAEELIGFVDCTDEELYQISGIPKERDLTKEEEKVARKRFTMIAPILPVVADEKKRNYIMEELSHNISKQTIRRYLCRYLAFEDFTVLVPMKVKERELSAEEKNYRWSLNKFYYSSHKNSLRTAYTLMLKEKYCDSQGRLLPNYPTFWSYRYFFRKHRNMRKEFIAREGVKSYERDYRPLLGDNVRDFATHLGICFVDATVCDIFLVDSSNAVLGRPILTAAVDGFSGLCYGYALTLEGGNYSLKTLLLNIITDKKNWCEQHGVLISDNEWNTNKLPGVFVTDMGKEYTSYEFENITELGVKVINLPPYRPDLKGPIEKFFDIIQSEFKPFTKGKGIIEPNYRERGARNYQEDAVLNFSEFEQILLRCIVFYNSKHVIENFPYTQEMLDAKVKPFCCDIFEWGLKNQLGANLIDVNSKDLILTLLPRTRGTFTRKGLKVNGLRYKNLNYVEEYLQGKEVQVAYNPENVSEVWVIEKSGFVSFEIIESRYADKSIEQMRQMKKDKQQLVKSVEQEELQARIDLAEHIQAIANKPRNQDVRLTDIRTTRKKETQLRHIDFVKEGISNG